MRILSLSKIEKLELIGLCVKSASGVVGGCLVLAEGHPYIATAVLAIGAISNEAVSYIKKKENEANLEASQEETEVAKG